MQCNTRTPTFDQLCYRQTGRQSHRARSENTGTSPFCSSSFRNRTKNTHRQLSVKSRLSELQLRRKELIRFPLVRNRQEQTNSVASSTCLSEPTHHHTPRKRLRRISLSIPPRAKDFLESSPIVSEQKPIVLVAASACRQLTVQAQFRVQCTPAMYSRGPEFNSWNRRLVSKRFAWLF